MSIKIHFTLFFHSPVLQSAEINRRGNANQDKNAKINSGENKLIYSIPGHSSPVLLKCTLLHDQNVFVHYCQFNARPLMRHNTFLLTVFSAQAYNQ